MISSFELLTPQVLAALSARDVTVADTYNCSEITTEIALRAPGCTAFHVHEDVVTVEIIGHDGTPCQDGTVGQLAISDLVNTAMSVLRLEIGDVGLLESAENSCRCGRAGKSLRILGRLAPNISPALRIELYDTIEEAAQAPVFLDVAADRALRVFCHSPASANARPPAISTTSGRWELTWHPVPPELAAGPGSQFIIDRRPRFNGGAW
jgi:hypothetical protein